MGEDSRIPAGPIRTLLLGAAATGLYILFGKLALLLAIPPGYASPIWPSAGIALAFCTVFGHRMLPFIFAGSAFLNWQLTFGASMPDAGTLRSLLTVVALALGASLQAAAGRWLIGRFLRGDISLTHQRDVANFGMVAILGCCVAGTVGVAALVLEGAVSLGRAPLHWLTWISGDTIGALIFAPITWTVIGRPTDVWHPRLIRFNGPILVTFCIIGGLFAFASHAEDERIRAKFGSQCEEFRIFLNAEIKEYGRELLAIRSFFISSDHVSREEFRKFTAETLRRHSGIRALEWVPWVRAAEREQYVLAAKEDGLQAYDFMEFGRDGELRTAGPRETYLPIHYVEPLEANALVLGLDLNSDAGRRAYLIKARDTGQRTASVLLHLAQDKEPSAEVLMASPIYSRPVVPPTVEERQQTFLGCAVGVFKTGRIVEDVLRKHPLSGMRIEISDITQPEDIRAAYSSSMDERDLHTQIDWRGPVRVNDRLWELRMRPTQAYVAGLQNWSVWFVLFFGFIFSAVLSAFHLIITGREAEVGRLVALRTSELDRAQKTLQAQYRHKEQLAKELSERTDDLKAQKSAILNVLEDSEKARLRAELAEAQTRDSMKAKSEFISVVSHELRTPLTVIKESVAMVEDGTTGPLNSDQKEFLETARRNVERLARLINDVLDFQKMEIGPILLNRAPCDLNRLIAQLEKDMASSAEKKNVRLICEMDPELPIVAADADRITQVLVNLTANAIKFTDSGSVTVRSRCDGEAGVKVEVEDEGIGIREEDFSRLFQAFSQLDAPGKRRTGSSGLGLAISKRIIEQHQGRIGVTSVPGKGSTFYFVLPII